MLPRIFLVVIAVATFGVLAMPAVAAKGGNSNTAKKECKNGGWENVVRADQTPFTSQKDCTKYAAQGGVLTDPYYAPRALCEAGGPQGPYVFSEGEQPSVSHGGPSYFRCFSGSDLYFNNAIYFGSSEVQAACRAYDETARLGSFEEQGSIAGVECSSYF